MFQWLFKSKYQTVCALQSAIRATQTQINKSISRLCFEILPVCIRQCNEGELFGIVQNQILRHLAKMRETHGPPEEKLGCVCVGLNGINTTVLKCYKTSK